MIIISINIYIFLHRIIEVPLCQNTKIMMMITFPGVRTDQIRLYTVRYIHILYTYISGMLNLPIFFLNFIFSKLNTNPGTVCC